MSVVVVGIGHSDVLMGVLCLNDDELEKRLRFVQFGECHNMHALVALLACARRSRFTITARLNLIQDYFHVHTHSFYTFLLCNAIAIFSSPCYNYIVCSP